MGKNVEQDARDRWIPGCRKLVRQKQTLHDSLNNVYNPLFFVIALIIKLAFKIPQTCLAAEASIWKQKLVFDPFKPKSWESLQHVMKGRDTQTRKLYI